MERLNGAELGDVVIRHGDVLIKKHDQALEGPISAQGLLYQGQNHSHYIKSGAFILKDNLLDVRDHCILTHAEHGDLTIPIGLYLVDIQQEYDHFLEESRNVID